MIFLVDGGRYEEQACEDDQITLEAGSGSGESGEAGYAPDGYGVELVLVHGCE